MSPPFVHEFRVRWGECDPQGIVFNAHYVAYFDNTITELWREAFGSYQAMVDGGHDIVVAEVNVKYLGSARPDEVIRAEATIERLGTTGMSTRMEILREHELLVEGQIRHVFVDAATLAKTPMPEYLRAGLAPFLAPPG